MDSADNASPLVSEAPGFQRGDHQYQLNNIDLRRTTTTKQIQEHVRYGSCVGEFSPNLPYLFSFVTKPFPTTFSYVTLVVTLVIQTSLRLE